MAERWPRKSVLVIADLIRASIALSLPFIDAVWQIYVLIFVLQSASAVFTPTFQAIIPDVVPGEKDYTRALSLSRVAYELENLASPAIAGLLLLVMSYSGLFAGTCIGFLLSAYLVVQTKLPPRKSTPERPFRDRLTRGIRLYLATPRLRGLLAVTMAAASVVAFVLVNTVVIVRRDFGGGEADLALALAAFGAGSMIAAIAVPRLVEGRADRPVMIGSAFAAGVISFAFGLWQVLGGGLTWTWFLLIWAILGACYSAVLTPSGRLIRRSAPSEDRPAVFTAQFALTHFCWLFTYPLAGWGGTMVGLPAVQTLLGVIACIAAAIAFRIWPRANRQDDAVAA